ncbi:MAG: hypothetical protein L6V93_04875 [Clostridiales bacterium]|nr:MAG: hypothetical protein L6V93_04875 [Clostridiales bacterium]
MKKLQSRKITRRVIFRKRKNWTLVWSDEFDGDKLDESKWNYRLYFWGKKSPTFTKEGVEVDGKSNLHIKLIEKDGNYFFRDTFKQVRLHTIYRKTATVSGLSASLKRQSLCINTDIMK